MAEQFEMHFFIYQITAIFFVESMKKFKCHFFHHFDLKIHQFSDLMNWFNKIFKESIECFLCLQINVDETKTIILFLSFEFNFKKLISGIIKPCLLILLFIFHAFIGVSFTKFRGVFFAKLNWHFLL